MNGKVGQIMHTLKPCHLLLPSASLFGVLLAAGTIPEFCRRALGRVHIVKELICIQVSTVLDPSSNTSIWDYLSANLETLRFLKLMWLFRVDVLDTRGDIFSSGAPKHIMAGKLAEAAARGEDLTMGAPEVKRLWTIARNAAAHGLLHYSPPIIITTTTTTRAK